MKITLPSKLWTDNLQLCCHPFYIGNVDNEESVYSANTREGPYFLPHLA